MTKYDAATIKAARAVGVRPEMKRNIQGALEIAVTPTLIQRIAQKWVMEHEPDFMIGNIVQTAEAVSYLQGVAEELEREIFTEVDNS